MYIAHVCIFSVYGTEDAATTSRCPVLHHPFVDSCLPPPVRDAFPVAPLYAPRSSCETSSSSDETSSDESEAVAASDRSSRNNIP